MILHCVFCQFKTDATEDARQAVLNGLADLCATLKGCLGFESGPNRDFEKKSAEYSDGFVIRFENEAALSAYANHRTHQALGAQLCQLCVDGADGIIVFDLEV